MMLASREPSRRHRLRSRRWGRRAIKIVLSLSPSSPTYSTITMPEDVSIPQTNSSFVLRSIKDVAFENRPIPQALGPNEYGFVLLPRGRRLR